MTEQYISNDYFLYNDFDNVNINKLLNKDKDVRKDAEKNVNQKLTTSLTKNKLTCSNSITKNLCDLEYKNKRHISLDEISNNNFNYTIKDKKIKR